MSFIATTGIALDDPYVPGVTPEVGKSASTNARNAVGAAAPEVGPAKTTLAGWSDCKRADPQLYVPVPPETRTCPFCPAGPIARSPQPP